MPGPKVKAEVLAQACDWQVQFDLDMGSGSSKNRHKFWHLPFPPEIAVVSGKGSRPDGVIWSTSKKIVIWIELISPCYVFAQQLVSNSPTQHKLLQYIAAT